MSKYVPNSYQKPNIYCDKYMAFLTGEEYKVLDYTVRRILGFHKESDNISISQYVSGIKSTKTGEQLDFGTGLGRETVIKCLKTLCEFGLLVKVAKNDKKENEGDLYSLQLDDELVKEDAIMGRQRERKEKARKRISKARSVKQTKRDADTQSVPQTTSRSVPQTDTQSVPQTHNIVVGNQEGNNVAQAWAELPAASDGMPPLDLKTFKKQKTSELDQIASLLLSVIRQQHLTTDQYKLISKSVRERATFAARGVSDDLHNGRYKWDDLEHAVEHFLNGAGEKYRKIICAPTTVAADIAEYIEQSKPQPEPERPRLPTVNMGAFPTGVKHEPAANPFQR